jgi:hypothetical protein
MSIIALTNATNQASVTMEVSVNKLGIITDTFLKNGSQVANTLLQEFHGNVDEMMNTGVQKIHVVVDLIASSVVVPILFTVCLVTVTIAMVCVARPCLAYRSQILQAKLQAKLRDQSIHPEKNVIVESA